MIRYQVTRQELEQRIETLTPGWLARAATRTQTFRTLGRYEESSPMWSDAKRAYMELQGESKCAFCERKLESAEYGAAEQDVEHFRPKGRVSAWKPTKALRDEGVQPTPVPAGCPGYHLLPYHILNYAAACKPCNSGLKKDYFPVAGAYQTGGDDPAALASELPFLVYPIGDLDADPEDLIDFHGVSPRARAAAGHDRHRALVTIEFFKLDDQRRKNLLRERAFVIVALHPQLQLTASPDAATRQRAESLVAAFVSDRAPHASCARSLKRLFENDPAAAAAIADAAAAYFLSIS